jgi:3-methyladenine DNA glycosylase AlkD
MGLRITGNAPPPADLDELRRELREAAEPERVPELQRFFKTSPGGYGEGDVFLGVRVPAVRVVARRHAGLDLADVTKLLRSPVHEERLAALVILVRLYSRADDQQRQRIYDLYLGNTAHVNGWDLVDVSAPHIVGAHLLDRRGAEHRVLDRLAYSPSVWERRMAIMATFAFVRAGECDETLRLACALLEDEHDLMHKAVGWMLREVGKRDEEPLVGFLRQHAGGMPRTMLRYAVERLDAPLRAELMAAPPFSPCGPVSAVRGISSGSPTPTCANTSRTSSATASSTVASAPWSLNSGRCRALWPRR